jgi:hypothetical protein
MSQKMSSHYFASDGNYGAADRVAIVKTEHWTEDDWLELEEAYDLDRIDVALVIDSKYRG